eukprot:4076952-Lingulodinium_polyedra.AAC.1
MATFDAEKLYPSINQQLCLQPLSIRGAKFYGNRRGALNDAICDILTIIMALQLVAFRPMPSNESRN